MVEREGKKMRRWKVEEIGEKRIVQAREYCLLDDGSIYRWEGVESSNPHPILRVTEIEEKPKRRKG
jgi:hypothetical protein